MCSLSFVPSLEFPSVTTITHGLVFVVIILRVFRCSLNFPVCHILFLLSTFLFSGFTLTLFLSEVLFCFHTLFPWLTACFTLHVTERWAGVRASLIRCHSHLTMESSESLQFLLAYYILPGIHGDHITTPDCLEDQTISFSIFRNREHSANICLVYVFLTILTQKCRLEYPTFLHTVKS